MSRERALLLAPAHTVSSQSSRALHGGTRAALLRTWLHCTELPALGTEYPKVLKPPCNWHGTEGPNWMENFWPLWPLVTCLLGSPQRQGLYLPCQTQGSPSRGMELPCLTWGSLRPETKPLPIGQGISQRQGLCLSCQTGVLCQQKDVLLPSDEGSAKIRSRATPIRLGTRSTDHVPLLPWSPGESSPLSFQILNSGQRQDSGERREGWAEGQNMRWRSSRCGSVVNESD